MTPLAPHITAYLRQRLPVCLDIMEVVEQGSPVRPITASKQRADDGGAPVAGLARPTSPRARQTNPRPGACRPAKSSF